MEHRTLGQSGQGLHNKAGSLERIDEGNMDMSMDIAPTLITLYDTVAANGQVPEDPDPEKEEERRREAESQQACESCDQEEPIASVPSSTTSAAACPRDSEGSLVAVDDVTEDPEKSCSTARAGLAKDRGREGCECAGEGREESVLLETNHSFLHASGKRIPLSDSACIDSYLDRTTSQDELLAKDSQNGGEGNNVSSCANMDSVSLCGNGKADLNGARDANFNVEHSIRMVSSDSPGENMAIDVDVDFNSNSNNDCRPRAQSADLLSDSRRWSQRQRPASAEVMSADYLCEGGPSSSTAHDDHHHQPKHVERVHEEEDDDEDEEEHKLHAPFRQNSSRINPPIVVTTTPLLNEAMSPPTSPPTSPPMSPTFKRPKSSVFSLTYLDRIVDEIIETERSYVKDLGDIIKGYSRAMQSKPEVQLSREKFDTLFCNLEDIHSFNRELLADLQQCDEDPVKLAECFLELEDDFCIYTRYCTNYPKAVDVMTECMKDPVISEFFRQQQASLSHGLSLGAYLLKPVQRILKYHLLFQDMMKHYKEEHGRDVIARALKSMTNVAWHINDMKRKHEASVHVQEIQSMLHGWQDDLNSYGDLVLEGVMRMQGARGDRFIYLFEKALLIGKKHENNNLISIKTQITCSNLMLIESIPKEPLGFNVIPFDKPDLQYTIVAKSQDQKKQWTHEIKRLILENYESNIPTKVKELILGTRAARREVESEHGAPSASPQDTSLSRDRKERKSRKKHKRRNSEPMGKLQRGQKQVKAAVENIITGMKRPDLSKLSSKKSNDLQQDDGTEDSLDEVETPKATKSYPSTPVHGEKVESLAPLARQEDLKDEVLSHQETSPESQRSSSKKLVLSKSLGDKKEANRDSGIGSMNLSEHLKLDSEDKSSADEAKTGDTRVTKKKGKRENGVKREDGLDDTEEEEGEVVKGSEGESPDELEVLEQLSDDNHQVKDPLLDIEMSPKAPRRSLGSMQAPALFKLRRVDLKEYRPLNDRFSKDHDDVWVPMANRPFVRNRSFSHLPSRPQSADVSIHPHFTKMRLSRTRSDDSSLHAWAELAKCRSDPNITDHKSDLGDSIQSNADKQDALGSSASTFGTVDGDLSSLSSHENLTDSINMAFQQLGAKYAAKEKSEGGTPVPPADLELTSPSDAAAAEKDETQLVIHDDDVMVVQPEAEDSDILNKGESNEVHATIDEDAESPESEEEMSEVRKKVQRLARKYSKMIKHQQESQSTIVVTRKASDSSSSDVDGKQVAWAVTHGQSGTVIKRFEIDRSSGSRTDSPSNSLSRSTTDSEEDRLSDSRRPLSRSANTRKSVRDVVRKFEVTKPAAPEPKVVTPVQEGIKERLRSFQQDNRQQSKSPQHRSSMGFKKLSERRKELEEWVAKPRQRSRHNSEGKDSTDGLSCSSSTSDVGELTFTFNSSSYQGSYASSLHSSGRSSPCPETCAANINIIKEDLLESISRLASTGSTTEEEVTPAMFKSIRERFEELEKAAHKPFPRTVTDPKEEIKASLTEDEIPAIQTDPVETEDKDFIPGPPLNIDLDLPFPEVFDTSSSELSLPGIKSSESLNTHLDGLDLVSSDNSSADVKQASASSDLLFPEIEQFESTPATTSETLPCISDVKVLTSDSSPEVRLEISLSSKKRELGHPTTLDVLSLYGGLSIDEALPGEGQNSLDLLPSSVRRSESSESSYKDAVSEKGLLSTPTSEEYVTAEEH